MVCLVFYTITSVSLLKSCLQLKSFNLITQQQQQCSYMCQIQRSNFILNHLFCCCPPSQVLHSLSFVVLYYGYFIWFIKSGRAKQIDDFPFQKLTDFLPNLNDDVNDDGRLVDQHAKGLTWSFFKQSILKQILTEGERTS